MNTSKKQHLRMILLQKQSEMYLEIIIFRISLRIGSKPDITHPAANSDKAAVVHGVNLLLLDQ